MTCREAIAVLADYLEAVLPPEALARFDAHLARCPECRAYLATYRATRDLVAASARIEMPEEVRRRLRAFLLEMLETS